VSFKKPTIEEIKTYAQEKNIDIDTEKFFYFYESKNWYVGKNKMVSWKSAMQTWVRGNDNAKIDKRTTAKKVSDKLKTIAEQDIAENGFVPLVD
jgi:hypothetical protein